MPTVRTTMQPDQEIEVGEAEYLDLKRQGLLLEAPASAPAVTPAAPAVPVKKTTAGAAGSKES